MTGMQFGFMVAGLVALAGVMGVSEFMRDKKEAKRRRKAVGRLRDLIKLYQGFVIGDEVVDSIYLADIEALEYAIKVLEEMGG